MAIAVAIYQNGPARLTGKTLQTLVQDAVMSKTDLKIFHLKLFIPFQKVKNLKHFNDFNPLKVVGIFNPDDFPNLNDTIWGVSIPNLVDDAGVAIPEPPNFGQMLPQVGELVAEKMVLRYNLQDNNKKFK